MRKRLIVLATALAFACLLDPNAAFASVVPVTIEIGADGAPVGTSGEGWTYADGVLTLDAGYAFTFTGHALNVSSENLLRNKGVIARSGTRNSSTEAGVEARRAQALAKHDRLQAGTGERRRTRRDGRCAPAANCAGHRASRRRRNADLRDRHADHAEKAEQPLVANERGHRQRTGHVERQHGGSLHETRPFLHKKTRRLIFRGRSLQQQFEQPKKTAGQGSALPNKGARFRFVAPFLSPVRQTSHLFVHRRGNLLHNRHRQTTQRGSPLTANGAERKKNESPAWAIRPLGPASRARAQAMSR